MLGEERVKRREVVPQDWIATINERSNFFKARVFLKLELSVLRFLLKTLILILLYSTSARK